MIPALFPLLEAEPTIRNLLGTAPVRIFPWGEAPEGINYPYVTYGLATGSPENYLDRVPDMDRLGTQVDVWAKTGESCREVAIAIRDVIEPVHHMTSMTNMERDRETGSYRIRMAFDFFTAR